MHQFSRTELLIGKEGLEKLNRSKIAVFGVGGVGSFVVEGLARAGVGSLVLIDNDYINVTNINRQIHSTISTIGRAKVEVMKERILDISPKVNVVAYQAFFSEDNATELIQADYDYIVDAIDTVSSKIELIVKAKKIGIPIISSMGAGNKLDPSKFKVSDIYNTSVCPLAKIMRRELKRRGVESLKVVYSTEKPIKLKIECQYDSQYGKNIKISENNKNSENSENSKNSENNEDCDEQQHESINQQYWNINRKYNGNTNVNTNVNTIGSISFVPSVAGLIIAGEVVKDLIGDKSDKYKLAKN